MKVTNAFFLTSMVSAFTSVSGIQSNLRSSIPKGSTTSGTSNVRIELYGLTASINDDEAQIINNSIMSAYNNVYEANGYSFTSLKIEPIGSEWGSWGCRLCPDNDDAVTTETMLANMKDMKKSLII